MRIQYPIRTQRLDAPARQHDHASAMIKRHIKTERLDEALEACAEKLESDIMLSRTRTSLLKGLEMTVKIQIRPGATPDTCVVAMTAQQRGHVSLLFKEAELETGHQDVE